MEGCVAMVYDNEGMRRKGRIGKGVYVMKVCGRREGGREGGEREKGRRREERWLELWTAWTQDSMGWVSGSPHGQTPCYISHTPSYTRTGSYLSLVELVH